MSRKLLIHCRHTPYGHSLARGGIEFAMAAAVFEQEIRLLFSGDGVWQLVKEQAAESIAAKNHAKMLSALPLYGVDAIFVDKSALQARLLTADDLCVDTTPADKATMQQLLADSTQVFTF